MGREYSARRETTCAPAYEPAAFSKNAGPCKPRPAKAGNCARTNARSRAPSRRTGFTAVRSSIIGAMDFSADFAGKAVLVTGAARGIGRTIALAFARQGARVALHYHRNRAAAEATAAELPGGPHTLIQGDLAQAK